MNYTIDELVKLQYAANKIQASSLLIQGVICSAGVNESMVYQLECEIKEAMKVINEIGPL